MSTILYVGCPKPSYPGDPADLIDQLKAAPTGDAATWTLAVRHYKADGSIDAVSFASTTMQSPGPVLLLQPIQRNAYDAIYVRLGDRVPVLRRGVTNLNELSEAIAEAIADYARGEPMIPRDLAVALMLVHKLDSNHMWSGNAKSYMWTDDLSKGRGFDEAHACRLPDVLRILTGSEILVFKPSRARRKYALNPELRAEIHDMMRTRRFPDAVHSRLIVNDDRVSVRDIDHCIAEDAPNRE